MQGGRWTGVGYFGHKFFLIALSSLLILTDSQLILPTGPWPGLEAGALDGKQEVQLRLCS